MGPCKSQHHVSSAVSDLAGTDFTFPPLWKQLSGLGILNLVATISHLPLPRYVASISEMEELPRAKIPFCGIYLFTAHIRPRVCLCLSTGGGGGTYLPVDWEGGTYLPADGEGVPTFQLTGGGGTYLPADGVGWVPPCPR